MVAPVRFLAVLIIAVGLGACGHRRAPPLDPNRPRKVTGSRLSRTDAVTSSPVKVYTRSRLEGTGLTRVGSTLGRNASDSLVRMQDLDSEDPLPSPAPEVQPELDRADVIVDDEDDD